MTRCHTEETWAGTPTARSSTFTALPKRFIHLEPILQSCGGSGAIITVPFTCGRSLLDFASHVHRCAIQPSVLPVIGIAKHKNRRNPLQKAFVSQRGLYEPWEGLQGSARSCFRTRLVNSVKFLVSIVLAAASSSHAARSAHRCVTVT